VTTASSQELTYDPSDRELVRHPHEVFRRLRDEAPLSYNEEQDFYALSRFDDVEHALVDKETFISGRGVTLGLLKAGFEIPPGTVLIEDPPAHTVHRKLLSRMFTPKRVAELEPKTRQFCNELLDPLVGSGGFDFVEDVGKHVPTRVISMLMGIPDQDRDDVRDQLGGYGMELGGELLSGEMFAKYMDWRVDHPSDDIMTQLLYAEFEDEHGETRRLTREELLAYINIVALAGNETTRLLIGWMGKLLGDHPDQRRLLVEDPSLIPNAVDESLRLEGPTGQVARYVASDVELHGRTVPAGSHMALLVLSANHDERHFDDPDQFDVRRPVGQHLTLGFGTHFCLGAALARLEARVVIEEMLRRFPDWEVDEEGARMSGGEIELRGWERLPIVIR
jgi:cytochrome P450